MPLRVGTTLGAYEVVALEGVGGMGEVYRARDTKLRRDVALKVLPERFAADPHRLARFTREAHVLASLNHPNIAVIHGIEEAGSTPALVMEWVDGDTLADRIARGPLRAEDALAIAKQMADALEAAHGAGVIHRDLKPSNVKVRPDGSVKVLDFGLAKALNPMEPTEDDALTMTAQAGQTVMIGTAPYMSPEQARGQKVDKRTDVWAFGCVLYEMLAGRRAFAGENSAATVAAIVHDEPSWEGVPPFVRPLLQRCLEKNPARRLRDLGDAMSLVEIASSSSTSVPIPTHGKSRWISGVAIASLSLIVAAVVYLAPTRPVPAVVRFTVEVPRGRGDLGSAISPDGRRLAFVAAGPTGEDLLVIRHLDKLESTPLAGTDGAYSPFWSPDSESIGFFSQGKLKRVSASGGSVQTLCDVLSPASIPAGAWGANDSIIFAQSFGPIHKVSALGGTATPVTVVNEARREFGHYNPHFLPDGVHFAYEVGATPERLGIRVGSVQSPETTQLIPKSFFPFAVTSEGVVVVAEQGFLKALKPEGTQVATVSERIPISGGVLALTVSANGTIAYASQARTQLTWFDRSGQRLETVGPAGWNLAPALSPDDTKVAVGRDGDIWVLDLVRGGETRLTTDAGTEAWPLWSPDGSHILFQRGLTGTLVQKPSSGVGTEEVLLESAVAPFGWSADGRFVTYMAWGATTLGDLYTLSMGKERKTQPYLQTKFQEAENQLSPDGKMMAYDSFDSGRYDIYVQTFPPSHERWHISTAGGTQPAWRSDGRELFYLGLDRRLMAVDITTTPRFHAGVPRALFRLAGPTGAVRNSYSPSRDGQRFLVNSYVEDTTSTIAVLLNWTATTTP